MEPGLPADLVASLRQRLTSDEPCDFMLPARKRTAKPLSARRLMKVERELAFGLPSPLRDVYGLLANGGFGPGYGFIGLAGGVKSDVNTDVVEDYQLRLQTDVADPGWFWPSSVLAVCHWSCGVYPCIDCRSPEARVLRFDPNPVDQDWSAAWGSESADMIVWLGRWLAGDELFESGTPDGSFSIHR
jgi:hypothetical protein